MILRPLWGRGGRAALPLALSEVFEPKRKLRDE